jgi:hypothetical protein
MEESQLSSIYMYIPKQLLILILQLIGKHPTLNNDYVLMRYFAKSSILPDKLIEAKRNLITDGFIIVKDTQSTVRYFEITEKGKQLLKTIQSGEVFKLFCYGNR